MIDVAHQINAVRRQVGSRVLEAGEARVVTVSQTYATDPEDLWDAVTNPERLPRWFLPVSGELRVGGRYQLEGNASGTVERCDPPNGFFATWEYGGEVSWIDVRVLPDVEGKARLELEHIAHVDDERWAEFGPGAVGIGWDLALLGLALHVAGDAPAFAPEREADWLGSEEGRVFVMSSSERWREANMASGVDESAARGAAERVSAVYTASSEPSSDE
ncbi:SRPBCC family protein [Actinophytocola xanthii]|uniref:Polyketide cyclase n=1 Tax=Actinophytocola xanthii TaxID=1912961 RepID=A0A1Q8CYX9_9PSEU|nr:SRPBCC family protein [Actinophytocola xanthii]OLF19571.1 polyketide cyclase [Actinophytocola xanthii]